MGVAVGLWHPVSCAEHEFAHRVRLRFHEEKECAAKGQAHGHDSLLPAFRLLHSQKQVAHIHIVLAGTADFIHSHSGVEYHERHRMNTALDAVPGLVADERRFLLIGE